MRALIISRSVSLRDEGFTLIEAVISLFVVSVIMTMVPMIIQSLASVERSLASEQDFEWNVFLIQFEEEMADVETYRVGRNERIFFMKKGQTVSYERYGQSVRRQVGDRGHEIVLQQIKKITFIQGDRLLRLQVDYLDGKSAEAQFLLPPSLKEEADVE